MQKQKSQVCTLTQQHICSWPLSTDLVMKSSEGTEIYKEYFRAFILGMTVTPLSILSELLRTFKVLVFILCLWLVFGGR